MFQKQPCKLEQSAAKEFFKIWKYCHLCLFCFLQHSHTSVAWDCSIKSFPFVQVRRDADKGADKEVQDKDGWNKSAGSSWEHCFPAALIASAEYGKSWNKSQNLSIQQKASHSVRGCPARFSHPSHSVSQRSISRWEEKGFGFVQNNRQEINVQLCWGVINDGCGSVGLCSCSNLNLFPCNSISRIKIAVWMAKEFLHSWGGWWTKIFCVLLSQICFFFFNCTVSKKANNKKPPLSDQKSCYSVFDLYLSLAVACKTWVFFPVWGDAGMYTACVQHACCWFGFLMVPLHD